MGPAAGDLRQARPYFLLPLLGADPGGRRLAIRQIEAELLRARKTSEPYTDIFVFSHGWHRNIFSAVGAYDRLFSRFLLLWRRGVIQPPAGFKPLLVALHWHSDPGEDNWIDEDGRRDRQSFLTSIASVFDTGGDQSRFTNDFSDIYEFFTRISAPDVMPLDPGFDEDARRLTDRLKGYRFKYGNTGGAEAAFPGEKAMLAWRCYDEATACQMLVDQYDRPNPFNNPIQAIVSLASFVVGVAGVAAVASFLLARLVQMATGWPRLAAGYRAGLRALEAAAPHLSGLARGVDAALRGIVAVPVDCAGALAAAGLPRPFAAWLTAVLISLALLLFAWLWRNLPPGRKAAGFPLLSAFAGVAALAACASPLIVFALTTYIFHGWAVLLALWPAFMARLAFALGLTPAEARIAWIVLCLIAACVTSLLPPRLIGLYKERETREDPLGALFGLGVVLRDAIAAFGRLPLRIMIQSVQSDSAVYTYARQADRQLAFYEMQRKGVRAGVEAGSLLLGILRKARAGDLRVHLIGHSFGGLAVSNAARFLTTPESRPAPRGRSAAPGAVSLGSVCLLAPAMASAWFEHEAALRSNIRGALSCVYSYYDTANGFYYPLFNGGRLSAGSAGLFRVAADQAACGATSTSTRLVPMVLGKQGEFASLSRPPGLASMLEARYGAAASENRCINVDASRIMFEGSRLLGGGHDDVYKDDVVNLIWACTGGWNCAVDDVRP